MATPEEIIAAELGAELDARLATWRNELERLEAAEVRIKELKECIAWAEERRKEGVYRIAPPPPTRAELRALAEAKEAAEAANAEPVVVDSAVPTPEK